MGRRWDGGRERPACQSCGYVVYRNPAPVAMALAHQGGRLLLVRRAKEPLRGFWAPPAGYVEMDESAEEAAIREAREETGLEVVLDGLQGVYSQRDLGVVLIVYHGRVMGGRLASGDDAMEVGLFPYDSLPPQPPSHAGTRLDCWFLEVIGHLLAIPAP